MSRPRFEACSAPVPACPHSAMFGRIRKLEAVLTAIHRDYPCGDPDLDADFNEREALMRIHGIAAAALKED